MISGAAQADVCLLMVPADGNFTTAIQKGDHKAGEIQGQTRQHARLLNLLGVKQLIVGVNKMDSDTAGYKKERYDEIASEMKHMLVRVGWKQDFVDKSVPVLPISGWMGDNLIKQSEKMTWWSGQEVEIPPPGSGKLKIVTLLQALNDFVTVSAAAAPAAAVARGLRASGSCGLGRSSLPPLAAQRVRMCLQVLACLLLSTLLRPA